MSNHKTTILKTTDVEVSLNDTILLKGVTVSIQHNEIVAIVGSDNPAKRAFLRLFNRMDEYKKGFKKQGNVFFKEENVAQIKAELLRQEIGIVLAQPSIFLGTIIENLVFGLKIHHKEITVKNPKIEETLRQVGLWEKVRNRLEQQPHVLSKSDQQRLCIARCLMLNPSVILMEMPTGELQEKGRSRIEKLIFQLKEKYTILFIASDIQQAGRVSDKMAFFHNSRLLEFNDTPSFFTNPKNQIIENFITGRFD